MLHYSNLMLDNDPQSACYHCDEVASFISLHCVFVHTVLPLFVIVTLFLYQWDCLSPQRLDGRQTYDYRKIKITFGTDYGCCFVDLGKTR